MFPSNTTENERIRFHLWQNSEPENEYPAMNAADDRPAFPSMPQ